jgi:hypothetical protein
MARIEGVVREEGHGRVQVRFVPEGDR